MTDKQIIIDGVDVSGCGWYTQGATGMICADWHLSNNCSNNPNCHYKNWKHKEQECETLASQLDFEVQKKECLEQECEELKKQNNQFDNGINEQFSKIIELEGRNNLLKQTLNEIKEICNSVWGNGLDEEVDKFDLILQKISECEVTKVMELDLDREWTDALGNTYQQIRYDLTKAVMEQVEAMREYQDTLVLKNLPQDVLENFKRRIELELLRREKGDFDPEYTIAYYMWERERKEKGYLREE